MGDQPDKGAPLTRETDSLDLSLLTPRQRKFIVHYFESGDVGKAAIAAGIYKKKAGAKGLERVKAASAGSRLLRKIRPQVEEMMDAAGLSAVQILRSLQEGFTASVEVLGYVEVDEPSKEDPTKTVKVLRRVPVTIPDFRSRGKYQEMAMKARGMFPSAPPAVVNVKPGVTDDQILTLQHSESLRGRSKEELEKMLDEAVNRRKVGRLKVV
jgi:hypothetical protein